MGRGNGQIEAEDAGRELTELRDQLDATGDILRIISRSPTDAQPVFQAIVESAARLCGAEFCFVDMFDGEMLNFVAHYGLTPEALEAVGRLFPMPPGRGSAAARAIHTRAVAQIPDISADPEYEVSEIPDSLRAQSALSVPLLKDGMPIGVITVDRREVGEFPARQIELLQTFADQAVIAIENVRLFKEVQARKNEVEEALEQQRATSDVLGIIATSPKNLDPVLAAVTASAAKLCDAYDVVIRLQIGETLVLAAHSGPVSVDSAPWPLERGRVAARCVMDCATIHIADLTAVGDDFASARETAMRHGIRTILATPLLRESQAIGAIVLRRKQVKPFSEKQIGLLKTFADQAVIAIENTRLFSELEARNRELSESLEQQTATADVLKAISRSTFDLDTVLTTLIASASRLCNAGPAQVWRRDGDVYKLAVSHRFGPDYVQLEQLQHIRPGRGSTVARALLEMRAVQIADVLEDPEYEEKVEARVGNIRTVLAAPLLRDGEPIGVFSFARHKAEPFSQRQIELIETFADQAVIAIENSRLFSELETRNREILSRYFSPNLADKLVGGADEIELAGQRRHVAALFTDIEGFTSLVETMEPGILGELLNGYLAGMTSVVFSYEGTVAKIVGDALHVLFGAPGNQPDHAARAVACALDLDRFAQTFRETWLEKGVAVGPTRMGVNAGPAIVGNFGGGRFFDYTAYGDTINIAARLEAANKQLGTRICISHNVAEKALNFRGRPVGDLVLRGRSEPLRAFEPLWLEPNDEPSTEGYLAAFARLEAHDPAALGAFAAEVGRHPNDRLASFHLKRLLNGETGTRITMD